MIVKHITSVYPAQVLRGWWMWSCTCGEDREEFRRWIDAVDDADTHALLAESLTAEDLTDPV